MGRRGRVVLLQLIFGMPSANRNQKLAQELLKRKGARPCLVLVPEQLSVTMERRLLEEIGDELSLWVEVLSFRRLPDYVFDRLGGRTRQTLNEGGVRILLSGALQPLRPHLRHFGAASQKPDFIELLRSQFQEFAAYETDPDDLMALSQELPDRALSDKLHDLALLYQGMLARMGETKSAEFALDAACDLLRQDNLFASVDLFLWHFKGFTPQEFAAIELMLASGSTVTACLLGEEGGGDDALDLFSPCRATAQQLHRAARQLGCGLLPEETLPPETAPTSLRHLERYAFQEGAPCWEGPLQDLAVAGAVTPAGEAEYVAAQICTLARQGERWRDIAVVVREAAESGVLEATFRKFGIPLQIDNRGDLMDKPLAALLFSAMQAVTGGYACDDVLAYLKTGLAGLEVDEVDRLESYAAAWNLRGRRWTKPFSLHPDGFDGVFDESARRRLHRLEALRMRAIAPLQTLERALSTGGARGISCALYALMEDVGVKEQLEARIERAREDADEATALEYEQAYEVVISLLEQMEALAEPEVSAGRYAELLRLAASQSRLGIIPATLDCVLVIGADRVMPGMVKHAFVMDFTQDSFPKPPTTGGLLTDLDKQSLRSHHMALSPGGVQESLEESYYAYLAMMAPTKTLTLTYALRSGEEQRRPSPYLMSLKGLFPALTQVDIEAWRQTPKSICAPAQALERLLTLEDGHPMKAPLRAAIEGDALLAPRLSQLERAMEKAGSDPAFAHPAVARALYQRRGALSPTSLERYAQCPFSHFCRYGLSLKPRKKHEFDAMQAGTFLHHVMELFFKDLPADVRNSMSSKEARARIDDITGAYLAEHLPDFDEKDARFRTLFDRLRHILYHTIDILLDELKHSDFVPLDFELTIGGDIPALLIGEGEDAVVVRGKVDRVDGLQKDGATYLRVVDYKTGKKRIDYAELYRGIGLQMLLYLFALLKNGKGRYGDRLLPAGVVYAPVRLDVVAADSRDVSQSELRAKRKPRRNGLLLDEQELLLSMDKSGAFDYLPVTAKNKDGQIVVDRRYSSLASLEELGALAHYTEKLLCDAAQALRGGGVSIDPVRSVGQDGIDACRFCEMRAVCRFEGRARTLQPMRAEQFWEVVIGKENGHG